MGWVIGVALALLAFWFFVIRGEETTVYGPFETRSGEIKQVVMVEDRNWFFVQKRYDVYVLVRLKDGTTMKENYYRWYSEDYAADHYADEVRKLEREKQ